MIKRNKTQTTRQDFISVIAGRFYNESASFFDSLRLKKSAEGSVAHALQSVEVSDYIRKNMAEYRRR